MLPYRTRRCKDEHSLGAKAADDEHPVGAVVLEGHAVVQQAEDEDANEGAEEGEEDVRHGREGRRVAAAGHAQVKRQRVPLRHCLRWREMDRGSGGGGERERGRAWEE